MSRVLLVLDEWTPDNGLVTAAFKIRRWVYLLLLCLRTVLRIRDVYRESRFLAIPDLGSRIQQQQQKRMVEINSSIAFFVATHF